LFEGDEVDQPCVGNSDVAPEEHVTLAGACYGRP